MINLPCKFESLRFEDYSYSQVNGEMNLCYSYLEDRKICKYDTKYLAHSTKEVVPSDFGDEVNGFQRVLFSNGLIGFRDLASGEILPYRYCIASDFNEYGFAMVGDIKGVSWIDKSFKKLTSRGKWELPGFGETSMPICQISDFSSGISCIKCGGYSKKSIMFIDTNGVVVEFKNLITGEEVPFEGNNTDFTNGYSLTDKGVYFADGKFMTFEAIVKLPEMREILSSFASGSIAVSTEDSIGENGRQMNFNSSRKRY